jgi:hypothetical protein
MDTRSAPGACSGSRFPWQHLKALVGPLLASEVKTAFFFFAANEST